MKPYVRDHKNNRTHVRPSGTVLQASMFNVDEKLSRMIRALQSAPSRPKKPPTPVTVRKFSWEV
jgi:hypothetical protein